MTIIEEILAFQPVAEVNESFKLQKKRLPPSNVRSALTSTYIANSLYLLQ